MSEIRHSVCALACPDACSMLVTVEDGKATRLRGNPEHPITRGFICGKVAQYLDREYSPERLLYPQKRAGAKGEGRFARISWEEALDEIAARLRSVAAEFGSEAILPYSYAGTMGYLNGSGMDRRFFHRLGASRLDRTICSSAGGVGLTQALEYATTRPAVIRLNYGTQRSERGAMAVRTVALLPALTGSWKDVGGGLQLSTSQAFQMNRPALELPELQQRALGREARILNMSRLGQALNDIDDPP